MNAKNEGKKVYGYVRVSTKEQNEDRQLVALRKHGIAKRNIFTDKQSGRDFNRDEYARLMLKLKEGDLLVVKSIDRLGRNYEEILEQWRIITREKGADIRILDMPLLDTTNSKDLLGTFIADLVLQVLSFAAENEMSNIRQRQREGIETAKAKGVRFGRPPIENDGIGRAIELYRQKKIPLDEAVSMSGMSRSGFYRRLSG